MAAPDLGRVRERLEARPELLRHGPAPSSTASSTTSSTATSPVAAGLENDIDEIEDEVFGGNGRQFAADLRVGSRGDRVPARGQAAAGILSQLIELPGVDEEERRYLRDVQDHAMRVEEQVDGFRALLQNILNVHLALETKR